MSYQDRLQPVIVLTSPSGVVFNAKWAGDDRTMEKTLGVFKTPGVSGAIIQDLATGGVAYPLTIFFDGPDNDIEANLFFKTCRETGPWTVIHPVHGEKTLQLQSVSESTQPISSGGVTEISTEWLEVRISTDVKESAGLPSVSRARPSVVVKTAPQIAALVKNQNTILKVTAAEQFDSVIELDTADKVGKLKVAVADTVESFTLNLESLTALVAEVQAQVDSIKKGIDETIFGPLTDVLALAGQIQALIATPGQIISDFKAKVEAYRRFRDKILGRSPGTPSSSNVNTAATQELSLTAALGGIGISSISTPLGSRASAIGGIEGAVEYFDGMTDGLDLTQDLYANNLLINSYFSQSQSYADAAYLASLTNAFLITSSFGLAVEKRITLTKPENPVMIAMREYQGAGDGDSNINRFYETNKLTGQETILLPAGKEVVVYLGGI